MKTILITGATSGIGEALAIHAAQSGYKVLACGRNQQKLGQLAKDFGVEPVQFDVTDEQATLDALNEVNFDIAVLNAGTCEYVDLPEFEPAMFRRVFEVNFFGIINCVNALLPKSKAGTQLVIIDSMARLFPFTRSQAYGASKAAVHYFTQSMKIDLKQRGIVVQSVSPGFVETPLTDKNDFDMPMKITAREAAQALLTGIEQKRSAVYFPTAFGLILRTLFRLPGRLQVWLSAKLQ
ncbi:SDR family NAD(P)-dependent oxidoreductase [Alteromonas lipolytica]|uniref:Short-chain dehydrogenase n=1 Tax=Alteromonas lipolytica TaxID=1856405 RepID=A0A1E8F999_9ALTE|nr:SDR family NAD(P)-dependent oxidoreductase [Alteromonas lipolytica]OFI32484.1 short-chain dehydrogenase [Alteromonas lipolytica]GGF75789.1 short-chain dehydrogenase [Alteromonas lipolytica]